LEGELFGYEKGAFTGAISKRIGKFEEADEGTLFLDEIGDLDQSLQAKLLRALQEKEITRLGSNKVIKLDARIIVATHKTLLDEVKAGNFREDLYYRLLGLPIALPPLRDRGNDILILAKFFLDQFTKENQMNRIKLSPDAQQKLTGYVYPGNVRELRSIIELAAVLCENNEIKDSDISFGNAPNERAYLMKEMTLEEYTYHIIRTFLNKYDNNVLDVAARLDIGKSSIYRYLKEMEARGI
jgi:transcriptional regulator with GAF, ATPase, and Fis domain